MYRFFDSILISMNRLYWADFLAYPAADAFCMIGILCWINLHLTGFGTGTAASACIFIHSIAEHRNRIKYRVDCTQRTYVFAKRTINQNRQKNCNHQQYIFPRIQPAQRILHGFVQKHQGNSSLQGPRWTDKLTEIRRSLSQNVYQKQRQKNDKY